MRDRLLTRRERDVLAATCSGHAPKEIAYDSFVSLTTVKSQIGSAYRKLVAAGAIRTGNRAEACRWINRATSP